MQLEGILLLLIMIIFVPILYIASNDTVFFIIFSLVIAFSSVKNILSPFLPDFIEDDEETQDIIEEIKDTINLDFNKLKSGFKCVKAMLYILYFIYSCFFIEKLIYKIASVFIIVFWIHSVIENINENSDDINSSKTETSFLAKFLNILVGIISLVVILTTNYNRFLR